MKKTLVIVLALVMALTMVMGSVTTVSAKGKPGTIHVTDVSLDKDDISIRVGESDNLTATIDPPNATKQKVSWTTSNRKVATVSRTSSLTTTVTGVAAGTATITVKTADGKFTDTCSVTVQPPVVPITGIGPISGTPEVGQTLTAGNLTPSDATATYQWQSCATINGTYSDIPGATSNTYDLVSADEDQYVRVSATGYGDYTGTVTSEPVLVTGIPLYTVTFNETNDVSDVSIDVYDDEWNYIDYVTTNSSGEATIQLPDGDYYYDAYCDGYAEIYDEPFSVSGTDTTVDFEMVPYIYTVTFEVVDADGEYPVSEVWIDVYDYDEEWIDTLYTDYDGEATIELPDGDYYYDAGCYGYVDIYDGEFTVSGTDMTVDFEMVPYTYTVTFEVVDGNGGAPVSDVGIDVYDSYYSYCIETVYTDSYGEATIQLSSGSYYYDVSSLPDGYHYLGGKVYFDVYNSDSTQYLELWTS